MTPSSRQPGPQAWDDTAAGGLFSANVGLDQPFADRRDAIDRIRRRAGDFRADPGRQPEYDSPAHCRWWLRGAGGAIAQADVAAAP